mmetsp:Transcript_4149/g.8145  ORF Transcript_4149/g.8145 Transcript_4149/m.8145 type:complete len:396 (+) Transcript_4149:169-1356(+)
MERPCPCSFSVVSSRRHQRAVRSSHPSVATRRSRLQRRRAHCRPRRERSTFTLLASLNASSISSPLLQLQSCCCDYCHDCNSCRRPAPMVGKPIYGCSSKPKARGNGSGKSSSGIEGDETSCWLTITHAHGEKQQMAQHTTVLAAINAEIPAVPADMRDSIAASLIEYGAARQPDCIEGWCELVHELLCEDLGIDLRADEFDETSEEEYIQQLVASLTKRGVLHRKPPPSKPLQAGEAVLAVLQEDGEWHEATVEEVSATLPRMLVVRFRQWPKLQSTPATEVIAVSASVDDAQEEVQHGACELCKCKRRLTFHHLIPKETHHRFVGNSLPAGLDGEPTRIFLGSYGANLCRPCHSQERSKPTRQRGSMSIERLHGVPCDAAQQSDSRFNTLRAE